MIKESYTVLENMEKMLMNLTDRQKEWYQPYQSYEIALLHFQNKIIRNLLNMSKKQLIIILVS